MDWTDEGIVLAARKHGESAAIVTLLTESHGRHLGLVRGGAGRRLRGVYQPGNHVAARWRGRLAEHLGSITGELIHSYAGGVIDDPLRLVGLQSACALADSVLPEREPHARLFAALGELLDRIAGDDSWPADYVRFELDLLREIGYGLDLEACAVTGTNDALAYVSPRSGRAVSLSAGAPYRDKLLPLPAFLIGGPAPNRAAVLDGLGLTGYFLEGRVFAIAERRAPAARMWLIDRLGR